MFNFYYLTFIMEIFKHIENKDSNLMEPCHLPWTICNYVIKKKKQIVHVDWGFID